MTSSMDSRVEGAMELEKERSTVGEYSSPTNKVWDSFEKAINSVKPYILSAMQFKPNSREQEDNQSKETHFIYRRRYAGEYDKPKRTYGEIKAEPPDPTYAKPANRLPTIHPEVQKWFQTMDTKNDGKITAKELQQAFEIFQGKYFSDSACKFVVRLFDLDQNGGLDVREFEMLYYYIKQWVNAFNAYDRDRTGFLDETQLDYALKHMDIHFSPDFIKFLITRNNPNAKKLSLDQFIVTCIQIQRYTDEFKARDIDYSGHINVRYEDFLEMIMRCL